jgi:hypothetical protein
MLIFEHKGILYKDYLYKISWGEGTGEVGAKRERESVP